MFTLSQFCCGARSAEPSRKRGGLAARRIAFFKPAAGTPGSLSQDDRSSSPCTNDNDQGSGATT